MKYYKIAGQILLLNLDDRYIHDNFSVFETEPCNVDLTIDVKEDSIITEPSLNPLISSAYSKVFQTEDGYLLFYPMIHNLNATSFSATKSAGTIYLQNMPDLSSTTDTNSSTDMPHLTLIDYIFFAIRDLFFIHIQQKNILAVHSSSILYRNKAYLFSACSGTGKTTHTNMWIKHYNVEILNGDVAAVCIENDQAIAYGLPWCGSSQQFQNLRIILGGIIFLEQKDCDTLRLLESFEATLRLAARCFTPTWNKEMSQLNLTVAEQLASMIPCSLLGCLPNKEAVDLVKDYIDSQQEGLC